MKNSLLQLIFGFIVLILGAGMEDLLPKFLGVGFPVLLVTAQFLAFLRVGLAEMLILAVIGGAFEDAISGLPPMTNVSYFLIIVSLVRRIGMPRLVTIVSYPCYQIWLSMWTSGLGGGIFNRILLSIPVGYITACAVVAVLSWISGKVAVVEHG